MASFAPEYGRITTIEKDALRAEKARGAFERSAWGGRIRLIESDAQDALKDLEEDSFDFVFMDAAKAQYLAFLPQVLRVLRSGGTLVSDNVLLDGVILEPHTALAHRDRTIHQKMRAYLRALRSNDALVTSIVPIGDGAAVTVKIS